MIRVLLLILFCLGSVEAWAKKPDGLAYVGTIGKPAATAINPDGSEAKYSGVLIDLKVVSPFVSNKSRTFSLNGSAGLKFMSLDNNAGSSAQDEMGNHNGYGVGLVFDIYNLNIGASYDFMSAKHLWVGGANTRAKFKYNALNTYISLGFKIGKSALFHVGYSQATATWEGDETGIGQDVDYSDRVFFLGIRFQTGDSAGDVIKNIVRGR